MRKMNFVDMGETMNHGLSEYKTWHFPIVFREAALCVKWRKVSNFPNWRHSSYLNWKKMFLTFCKFLYPPANQYSVLTSARCIYISRSAQRGDSLQLESISSLDLFSVGRFSWWRTSWGGWLSSAFPLLRQRKLLVQGASKKL
jgi:hypothetical protein